MNIMQLFESGNNNITVAVTLADLREYSLSLMADAAKTAKLEEDELISLEDAKKRPSISASDATLFRWDKSGYLPKTKIGGKVFYKLSDIKKIEEG